MRLMETSVRSAGMDMGKNLSFYQLMGRGGGPAGPMTQGERILRPVTSEGQI